MKLVAALAFVLVTGCGLGQSAPSSSVESPSGSPLAVPSGHLNAEVAMPAGFPGDVPIYPKARLTAGAGFVSTGQTSWGMEWETLDSVTKVQAFYEQNMSKGDWTISFAKKASDSFAATFGRKSNNAVTGTLASNSAGGVTRILMSLVAPLS